MARGMIRLPPEVVEINKRKAEEDKEIKCDYCRETFKAVTLKKYRRAARVITLRSLVNID